MNHDPKKQIPYEAGSKIDRMQPGRGKGNLIIYKHWKNHLVFHFRERERERGEFPAKMQQVPDELRRRFVIRTMSALLY